MKERFDNYRPTDFDSNNEELAPIQKTAAEAPVEPVAESVEAPQAEHVLARGEARFQKAGEKITGWKNGMRDFFAKIPQVASAWKRRAGEMVGTASRSAAIGVLSTPEIVGAGIDAAKEKGAAISSAAMEGATAGSKAVLHGVETAGNAIQGGLDAAADFALDTPEKIAAFGREKGEQFSAFVAQKAESVRAVADLAGTFTSEKAAQAREGIDFGIRSVTGWGERSLALAEAKRQEAIRNFRSQIDAARIARLEREHEATAEKLAQIRNKLGLSSELAQFQPIALAA